MIKRETEKGDGDKEGDGHGDGRFIIGTVYAMLRSDDNSSSHTSVEKEIGSTDNVLTKK